MCLQTSDLTLKQALFPIICKASFTRRSWMCDWGTINACLHCIAVSDIMSPCKMLMQIDMQKIAHLVPRYEWDDIEWKFLHEYWGFAANLKYCKSSIAELGNAETSHYKYCLENNKTEQVQIAAKNNSVNQSQTHWYVGLYTHCRQLCFAMCLQPCTCAVSCPSTHDEQTQQGNPWSQTTDVTTSSIENMIAKTYCRAQLLQNRDNSKRTDAITTWPANYIS